jgi:hypothetical protein
MFFKLFYRGKEIPFMKDFYTSNMILIKDYKSSSNAYFYEGNIYIAGQIMEEEISLWTKGPWRKSEMFTEEFQVSRNIYPIARGYTIRAIALETLDRLVIKIITRESSHREKEVSDRFPLINKTAFLPIHFS